MKITITKEMKDLATRVGKGRHEQNTLRRKATNDRSSRLSVKNDVYGALGEVVFHYIVHNKLPEYDKLVYDWREYQDIKKETADVAFEGHKFEVKTILKPTLNLIHNCLGFRSDKKESILVLIYLDIKKNNCTVMGMITAKEFEQRAVHRCQECGNNGCRKCYWFLAKNKLTTYDKFMRRMNEEM